MRKLRVAVDIGGTFTDLVAYDELTREVLTVKTPSTPPTFIDGVIAALDKAGIEPGEITAFKHGSTIATNTIIERSGAKTALVATHGMRDVLGAGRANRPDLFNSNWDPSPPLVQRRHVYTVRERIDYEGRVLTPLMEDDVREVARKLRLRGVESVAVAFLNSFMNATHELRTKEILLEELDGVPVCTSAETLPEIREFERTSTTAANAYLMPVIETYLGKLKQALAGWGYDGQVLVTHSGGGVITSRAAAAVPARVCHSGPAGGVIGGLLVGRSAGFDNVITFDMGGTSADLSLVDQSTPSLALEWKVDWNIPILFPAIDLVAIGAGGGTIAWVDAGGSLRVGPHSAGADPGPACFGKGNQEPTITDAHLFLGRLNPERYLGGDFTIHPDLAAQAITRLADRLGLSAADTASGILRIANANMSSATHLISVERGHDPRDYALVAGGGAGALHAVDIARELGIPHVVAPPTPGVTSALGILQVDLRHDIMRSILKQQHELDPRDLQRTFDELTSEAQQILDAEDIPAQRRRVELSLDVRYYGQVPYMNIVIDDVPGSADAIRRISERYGDQYEQEFGYRLDPQIGKVEFVNARVAAIGLTDDADPARRSEISQETEPYDVRAVYFDEARAYVDTPIWDRSKLGSGATLDGPAIIEQMDTTVLVPPGTRARVDSAGNIVIDINRDSAAPSGAQVATTGA